MSRLRQSSLQGLDTDERKQIGCSPPSRSKPSICPTTNCIHLSLWLHWIQSSLHVKANKGVAERKACQECHKTTRRWKKEGNEEISWEMKWQISETKDRSQGATCANRRGYRRFTGARANWREGRKTFTETRNKFHRCSSSVTRDSELGWIVTPPETKRSKIWCSE